MSIEVRLLEPRDSMAELTSLLHDAYRPLADAGLRFLASRQDEAKTRERCGEGECWVAELDGRLVGTVTWRRGDSGESCEHFSKPGVAVFGQYAVRPDLQRGGLGSRLLEVVERRAAESGCRELACDTAETAERLIAFYGKRGYRYVQHVKWDVVDYRSVVLSKTLARA